MRRFTSPPSRAIGWVFLSQANENRIDGVETIFYEPFRPITPGIHHYLADTEQAGALGPVRP